MYTKLQGAQYNSLIFVAKQVHFSDVIDKNSPKLNTNIETNSKLIIVNLLKLNFQLGMEYQILKKLLFINGAFSFQSTGVKW